MAKRPPRHRGDRRANPEFKTIQTNCDKVAYPTMADAEKASRWWTQSKKREPHHFRAYRCRHCGAIHLTTSERLEGL